ncbi:MAG: hypothetical protein KAT00_04770, partial [Planctomycetes bacterium]|nr:hypothetical protein [Planctomycetota bacterium]
MYLQVRHGAEYREQIRLMRILPPTQLPTVRGSIFDRTGRIIAADKPAFYLHINYRLTRYLDDRYRQGTIVIRQKAEEEKADAEVESEVNEEFRGRLEELEAIIERCATIKGTAPARLKENIKKINDRVWNRRRFFAWSTNCPYSELRTEYAGRFVPMSKAMEEFDYLFPDMKTRLELIMKADPLEAHQDYPLIELETEAQLLQGQLEFVNVDNIEINPRAKRTYPYKSAASQTIGWVGPAQQSDKELFAYDDYLRYLEGDVLGKSGAEMVCEAVLRGRRGEVTYDKDGHLVSRKLTEFGKDVTLSLDIVLQKNIESLLSDPNMNSNYDTAMGAVVIDVASGDILALVSLPVYDLSTIRQKYNEVLNAAGAPMINKALAEHYLPGSSIKPVILIIAMEEGKVGSGDVISCPYEDAGRSWPNCLMFRRFGSCHDWRWQDEGGNIARNAIRGSCNIYFSRLANRLDVRRLQEWLLRFGYGRKILPGPDFSNMPDAENRLDAANRNLRQSAGQISVRVVPDASSIEDIPNMGTFEKRMFGIGQGNLWATVLQVTNAMAVIARGGMYKPPRLFPGKSDEFNDRQEYIGISAASIRTVRDGMSAVVYEAGGTAYSTFENSDLGERDVKVFGKTGSTEKPNNAWFACFAEDGSGRSVAIAIVVEGGQSGSRDAAP